MLAADLAGRVRRLNYLVLLPFAHPPTLPSQNTAIRTFTRSRIGRGVIDLSQRCNAISCLRGEGNYLQEHCEYIGERSDHDMDARIFSKQVASLRLTECCCRVCLLAVGI